MLTRENYINSPVEIEFELLHFFNSKEPLIIFDIGACEAEDSIRYSDLFPESVVYAFEPRIDNCQKAKELIVQYNKSNIVLENIALSNKNGTADFYLSEGEPLELKNNEFWNYGNKSSSLLPPSEELKKHIAWLSFKEKMEVKTQRLDDYVAERNILTIDFMHIDVQGAELMVLEGAGNFLSRIKIIWMEVEAVQLYKDQPLKKDIEKFTKANQFINIIDTVSEISGDQLYVNKNYYSDIKINSLLAARKRIKRIAKIKSFLKFK